MCEPPDREPRCQRHRFPRSEALNKTSVFIITLLRINDRTERTSTPADRTSVSTLLPVRLIVVPITRSEAYFGVSFEWREHTRLLKRA